MTETIALLFCGTSQLLCEHLCFSSELSDRMAIDTSVIRYGWTCMGFVVGRWMTRPSFTVSHLHGGVIHLQSQLTAGHIWDESVRGSLSGIVYPIDDHAPASEDRFLVPPSRASG